MNKKIPFTLLAMSTMLLTACDTGISQEKFVEHLNATKANITLESEVLNNVHIKDKSSLNQTNYKEGEFYSKVSGLILTRVQEYTWKDEDGKYYHYKKSVLEDIDKEITKEQFDVYMATARGEICAKLNEGIMECENLLREEPETYINVKNAFYQTAKGEYRLNSTMTYKENGDGAEKTRKVIFLMKKNLPIKYTVKTDSEGTISYTYGNAKFTKPNKSNE